MSIFGSASGSDVSGIENQLAALTPIFEGYASQAAALAPGFENLSTSAQGLEPNFLNLASLFGTQASDLQGQGGQIFGPSFSQFQAGAQGQITPAQQAAVNQSLQQQNLQTAGTYGNLGLGGSTMETQDTNANAAKLLAQTQGFANLDEITGLGGLQQALGYYGGGLNALTGENQANTGALSTLTGAGSLLGGATNAFGTAGSILSGATGALNNAGSLAAGEQATQLGLLGSLGSALGGSSGLLGSSGPFGSGGIFGSLFGGGSSGLGTAAALGTGGLF